MFAFAGIKGRRGDSSGYDSSRAVIRLNVPVLLFSLAIAAVTACCSDWRPPYRRSGGISEPLKDSGKASAAASGMEAAQRPGGDWWRFRWCCGSGTADAQLRQMQQVDLGFDPRNATRAFRCRPNSTRPWKRSTGSSGSCCRACRPCRGAGGFQSSRRRRSRIRSDIEIPGKTHSEKWTTIFQLCSEGYFPTLGTKVLRGRTLSEVEVNDGRKVAVINQTLVSRYFGAEDPIGKRIKINMLEKLPDGRVENPSFEVIGVIQDVKNQGPQDPTSPEMFVPYTVTGAFDRSILVRTAKDPLAIQQAVRREIWAVDRNVALTFTGSLEEFLARFWYAGPRFALILLGVFAGVGLVLVALGVYSVIAYTVSRQTHEIGIRMALGAGATDVQRMVLSMGLRLIVFSVAAGLLASVVVSRLLRPALMSPHDPVPFRIGGGCGDIGMRRLLLPARRATHVDPRSFAVR